MAYPVRASAPVTAGQAFTVPFRPAAAGLVTAVVTAGPQNGVATTIALRLDILKPGAAAPVTSATGSLAVEPGGSDQQRLVVAAHTPAAAADLAADWHARVTNTGSSPAACTVVVRYQVLPGNLGKIDHIVVLMMENRSFDHMLGYLSIPGEGGRTDVDGLKGTEYNSDDAGNKVQVFRRVAPAPGRSDTSFLNDPEHGWGQVAAQISSDGAHASNAGFVRNFAQKLQRDVQNHPPPRVTIHDESKIAGGDSRTISFRPVNPGLISVRSVASSAPTHSETGLLGEVTIRRPGSNAVVGSGKAPIGQHAVAASHNATAAELATPGDWTCEVTNATEATVSFATDVSSAGTWEHPSGVMGYYDASQLPAYDLLAQHFAICDRWYASLPTDTFPNRLYAMTGGSGGLIDTPSTSQVETDPPGYTLKTIFEVLQERQVDWMIFFSDLPSALIFKALAQDAVYTARMRSVAELLQRAEIGDLPSLTWIDPNFSDVPDDPDAASDDHPPGDVCHGQRLIAQIYGALSRSPAWPKTLLIITYDEHGGFYDHVLPPGHATPQPPYPSTISEVPQPPAPGGPADDEPNLRVYGLRVPTFVVSPWVKPRSVSKEISDHTSLLRTILNRFCHGEDVPMGQRVAAAKDVGAVLSATTPHLDPPAAPVVGQCARFFEAATDPNAFGVVLRKTVLRF